MTDLLRPTISRDCREQGPDRDHVPLAAFTSNIVRQLEGESRKGPCMSVHNLATENILISDLHDSLQAMAPQRLPIRTGHAGGGWELMMRGAAESITFNTPLLGMNLANPLVVDHTKTPARDGSGDFLYLPGSIIENVVENNVEGEGLVHLPLYTVSNGQLIPYDRSKSLFSPLTYVSYEGNVIPMAQLHRERSKKLPLDQPLRFVSDYILQNWKQVEHIVNSLVAVGGDLTDIFQVIGHNAQPRDIKIIRQNGHVDIGNSEESPEALLERVYDTTRTIAGEISPLELEVKYKGKDAVYLSNELLIYLTSILGADITDGSQKFNGINTHYHWGGYQMAGAPPHIEGYIDSVKKGLIDSTKKLGPLHEHYPSTAFLLLPAAIYNLIPSTGNEEDMQIVSGLIEQVLDKVAPKRINGHKKHSQELHMTLQAWYSEHVYSLSNSFVQRFISTGDGVKGQYLRGNPLKLSGEPQVDFTIPAGFEDLTLKEVSQIIGFLMTQNFT